LIRSVDPSTVKFGPNQTPVHNDGNAVRLRDRLDLLVLGFKTQDTGVSCNDTSMFVRGRTFQGERIFGSDSVNLSTVEKTDDWENTVAHQSQSLLIRLHQHLVLKLISGRNKSHIPSTPAHLIN
jgi:hypothetical protein